jgi:hypothetical protein
VVHKVGVRKGGAQLRERPWPKMAHGWTRGMSKVEAVGAQEGRMGAAATADGGGGATAAHPLAAAGPVAAKATTVHPRG